jgi:hypothetical protein
MIFLFIYFLLFDLQKEFYLDGFLETSLGFKLDSTSIENLKKNIENYPKCDFFYVPLLKEKDEIAFKNFFNNSGNEPIILLYFLRNYDAYEDILKKNKIDKIELLKRFLWAEQIEREKNFCPFNINSKKPKILGFQDEVSSECYKLFFLYSISEYNDSIEFSSCEPILKEAIQEDLLNLMKRYKIPLVHRNIIETKQQKIIKKSK